MLSYKGVLVGVSDGVLARVLVAVGAIDANFSVLNVNIRTPVL